MSVDFMVSSYSIPSYVSIVHAMLPSSKYSHHGLGSGFSVLVVVVAVDVVDLVVVVIIGLVVAVIVCLVVVVVGALVVVVVVWVVTQNGDI